MTSEPELRRYLRRLRFKRRLEGPRLDMRPRVHAPTTLQKIFKQRNQKRSTYYVTTGRKLPERKSEDDVEKAKPFWTPAPQQLEAYVAFQKERAEKDRKKELGLPAHQKHNARTRLVADLAERLHVPDDPPPAEKTMVDMDPEFYTIVEGRPNRDRTSVRDYINQIRDLVRVRLKIGFNEDECILVDEQFRAEQERLDKILAQHKQYVDVFDQFLADDHAASMELLKKADQAARESANKNEEVKAWIRTLGLTRTQVYKLEEKWRSARSLQRFLYMVSPMSWRREHDHVNDTVVEADASSHGTASTLASTAASTTAGTVIATTASHRDRRHSGATQATQFSTYEHLDRAVSLQEIIDTFMEETKSGQLEEPKLYFTEPEQLVKVFRSLAAQSLASLVHIEQLRLPLEALQAGVAQAKERVERELQVLREQVDDLEKDIAWEEERVTKLKENADAAIAATYKDIMSGDSNVLALHVWVEDVYEHCVAPNDSHLTAYQMMCAVERQVAKELLALDYLDQTHVKRARKQVYLEEKMESRSASDAQRKLQQLDQLVYRMERALEPPPPRGRRLLVFRSQPPEPKKPPPPPEAHLSEEELDRIAFFSECKTADELRKHFPPVPLRLSRRDTLSGRRSELSSDPASQERIFGMKEEPAAALLAMEQIG